MSFCNFKTEKSEDDDDYIFDDSNSTSDFNEYRTNSSSCSLKWSVDARKQNEDDWQQIERVLFGEEKLPEGEKENLLKNYYRFFSFYFLCFCYLLSSNVWHSCLNFR